MTDTKLISTEKTVENHYIQTAEFITTNSRISPDIVNDYLILAIDRSISKNEPVSLQIKSRVRARRWLDKKYQDLKEKKPHKKRKHRRVKKTEGNKKVTSTSKVKRTKVTRKPRLLTKIPNPVLSENISIYLGKSSSSVNQLGTGKAIIKI